jgi:hypothetical protein
MAAAAAFQIELPAIGDGAGLARHGILKIFFGGRLSAEKGHTEQAKY